MSLGKCYKCHYVVSVETEICANCGANLRKDRKSFVKGLCLLAILLALLLALLSWL